MGLEGTVVLLLLQLLPLLLLLLLHPLRMDRMGRRALPPIFPGGMQAPRQGAHPAQRQPMRPRRQALDGGGDKSWKQQDTKMKTQ